MAEFVNTLILLAVLFQTHEIGLTNEPDSRILSKNPTPGSSDPFISSTTYKDKVFLVPWMADRIGDWYFNRGYCAEHGAEMVTIHSQAENNFFHSFMRSVGMQKEGVWLGAQIVDKKDIKLWGNGQNFDYLATKGPQEYNEDGPEGITCLVSGWTLTDNWWGNQFCTPHKAYIACQRPANDLTTTCSKNAACACNKRSDCCNCNSCDC